MSNNGGACQIVFISKFESYSKFRYEFVKYDNYSQ